MLKKRFVVLFAVISFSLPSCSGSSSDLLFAKSSFPILTDFPSGHGREMLTLPMGVEARLDTESKSLEFENCGVL